MRFGAIVILLTQALYISALNAANPIIVVSIDGLRPDAIKKAKAKNLMRLLESGTSFCNARTVRPSITLPSHTSMMTGLDPAQHGITWNDYRPAYGPVRHKTAPEIANDAGLHAIMIVAKDKLKHLNRPNSLDHFQKTDKKGEAVAEAFGDYVEENGMPDVSFLHLPDPDKMGHLLMWMSPFYLYAVRKADKALGQILEVAKEHSPDGKPPTVIITADHGGNGFGHLADIDVNNTIPFITSGEGIEANLVKDDNVRVYDTAATVLSLLSLPIPGHWKGKPAPIFSEPKVNSIRNHPQTMQARLDY